MPILKRLVYVYKVRVVSVTEGVDSAREGWEQIAQILLMQHERYVKELGHNTFRGQEALARNKDKPFSIGDYCFGYMSIPDPGGATAGRGRHARPRMIYAIDPTTSPWVRRIFDWFVVERRPLRWIARQLNRLGAPKDHRASNPNWTHQLVLAVLRRIKYIGVWPWGLNQNVRDPETGDVHQELRSEEVTKDWVRQFPDLRLIEDGIFFKAQQLLDENAVKGVRRHDADGHFSDDQSGAAADAPCHLLSGLIVCGQCGRAFYVGGAMGKYLFCPSYSPGLCPCQTTLRRDLAEQLILKAISDRILANSSCLEAVYHATLSAWRRLQDSLPSDLRDTESALAEVTRKIGRLVDQVENEDHPDPDLAERLAERRGERQALEAKLDGLRRKAEHRPQEPTMEWVQEKLIQLDQVLSEPTPAAAFALRELVGGQIVVDEVRTEGRKRFFLRGKFTIGLGQVLKGLATEGDQAAEGNAGLQEQITIDFVRSNPLDAKAEEAKANWDAELLGVEIAQKMGVSRAQVTKLLKHWSKLHGVPLPDGHARRARLERKHTKPPLFEAIAAEVERMLGEGLLIVEIAARLKCDKNTITKSIDFLRKTRGLEIPDGRTRRKGLDHKNSQPRRAGGDESS